MVQISDNAGAVTKTYVYDAFGNELNPDPNDANPLRYAGEYYDAEMGTYYLRARYYDAAIGRFIGEDTWTGNANDPLSLNRYTYCYNNPVRYYDSSGNIPVETILDVASIAWSAVELWNNPSWENLGFLLWDVAATAIPYIPGSYVVKAGVALSKVDEFAELGKIGKEKGAATVSEAVSDNVQQAAKSESGKVSKFQEVFDIADNYTLSDDIFNNHILDRHGPNSTYGDKSRFNADFDIRNGIDSTLTGDNFVVGSNTAGRDGYIFEQTFTNPIGTNNRGKPLYTLKVVIDETGNVVTAFPKN